VGARHPHADAHSYLYAYAKRDTHGAENAHGHRYTRTRRPTLLPATTHEGLVHVGARHTCAHNHGHTPWLCHPLVASDELMG
jgi:hypothetical protein